MLVGTEKFSPKQERHPSVLVVTLISAIQHASCSLIADITTTPAPCTPPCQTTLAHWCVTGLDLLGRLDMCSEADRMAVKAWILAQQVTGTVSAVDTHCYNICSRSQVLFTAVDTHCYNI